MIMMIIAELSGRRRQSPIVHGEEGQCLGTKDTLSIDLTEAMFTQIESDIQYNPDNSNSDNSNSPRTRPLDSTPLFSHF